MKFLGAGFRNDGDLGTGVATVFGLEVVDEDFDFFDGIHGDGGDGDVDVVGIAGDHAVDGDGGVSGAEAADVGGGGADFGAEGVGVGVLGDAGHEAEEGHDVASAGEEGAHLFGVEEGGVFGGGGLDDGAAGGDVDDFCGAAGLEGEGTGGEVFVGSDGDGFAFDGLEALEGDAEGVGSGGNAGEGEVAGGVGEGFSGVAGGFAGEGDLGPEDVGTAGIEDDADDGTGVELGE